MTYWVLTERGSNIARSSAITVSDHDKHNTIQIQHQEAFMSRLLELKNMEMISEQIFVSAEEDDDKDDNVYNMAGDDNYMPESLDEYLSAQVMLSIGGSYQRGEVIC